MVLMGARDTFSSSPQFYRVFVLFFVFSSPDNAFNLLFPRVEAEEENAVA